MIVPFSVGVLATSTTTAGLPSTDPYWDSVTLLMHMDGANNDVTFTEHTGKTITVAAGPVISTNNARFGNSSAKFNGSGGISVMTDPGFGFGTGDFTTEMWISTTSNTATWKALIVHEWDGAGYDGGWSLLINSGNVYLWAANYSTGSPLLATSGLTLADGSWHHIAWVCQSGVHTMYADGIPAASIAASPTLSDAGRNITIGQDNTFEGGSRGFVGYIDDVRITKGRARYTSAFTVPTAAFPNH